MGDVVEYTKSNTELFKEMLTLESDEETGNDDTKMCLISMLPLDNHYITLECGHTFNYDPLFKDVYNHKKKFLRLESRSLKPNELRCPYCRNIQTKLLPLNPGSPLIYGVNSLNSKLDTMTRKMRYWQLYYKIFHTYTRGMCCYGMTKYSIVKEGFYETDVKCLNTKVKYNNINGLVYCAGHYHQITTSIFNTEIIRLKNIIDKYQTIINTAKGPKKQASRKKMSAIMLVCDNMEDVIDKKNIEHIEDTEEMDDNGKSNDDDEWETPFDYTNKYSQQCRCFAYYTSGAKKDTRCVNLATGGLGSGYGLYCSKHPYISGDLT